MGRRDFYLRGTPGSMIEQINMERRYYISALSGLGIQAEKVRCSQGAAVDFKAGSVRPSDPWAIL
jgi:hypothetical protein